MRPPSHFRGSNSDSDRARASRLTPTMDTESSLAARGYAGRLLRAEFFVVVVYSSANVALTLSAIAFAPLWKMTLYGRSMRHYGLWKPDQWDCWKSEQTISMGKRIHFPRARKQKASQSLLCLGKHRLCPMNRYITCLNLGSE
jgi:hypothetical protein